MGREAPAPFVSGTSNIHPEYLGFRIYAGLTPRTVSKLR